MHGHPLAEEPRGEGVRRAVDRVRHEVDPALPGPRVADVDPPVGVHGRGQEPAQRSQDTRAEVAVAEGEERQQGMRAAGAEAVDLEA